MRIVIAGGTGLIGTALAKSLARDGHEVSVLSRHPDQSKSSLPQSIKLVSWDGRTSGAWARIIDGSDAIVNLAGESIAGDSLVSLITKRWSAPRLNSILQSRLDAGSAILEAIRNANNKPSVLVQASAVGIYGSRGEEILTEESAPGTDQIANICAAWEKSTAAAEGMGVRRVVIRTGGVVMSTSGGAFPFMLLPFRLFLGGPLGSGRAWFSWIHISDEVKAIQHFIDNRNAAGIFNLCAPQSITNKEFSRSLGKVLHRPSSIPMPAFALYLLFGEKASILLASQRQVPNRLVEMGFQFDFPQIEGALQDLL